MLGGYFLVYLFSSGGSVRDFIGGSFGRRCLQLWPGERVSTRDVFLADFYGTGK